MMAWRRIGAKPLSEPMLTQFTAAYLRHQGGDELTLQFPPHDTTIIVCVVLGMYKKNAQEHSNLRLLKFHL